MLSKNVEKNLITISNAFHRTHVRVRNQRPAPHTIKRIEKKLCGMSDCTCGDIVGEQSPEARAWIAKYIGGA